MLVNILDFVNFSVSLSLFPLKIENAVLLLRSVLM